MINTHTLTHTHTHTCVPTGPDMCVALLSTWLLSLATAYMVLPHSCPLIYEGPITGVGPRSTLHGAHRDLRYQHNRGPLDSGQTLSLSLSFSPALSLSFPPALSLSLSPAVSLSLSPSIFLSPALPSSFCSVQPAAQEGRHDEASQSRGVAVGGGGQGGHVTSGQSVRPPPVYLLFRVTP